MLYFSDTVCVLRLSSSLPALDGALESSYGPGLYILLSLLPASELQLVLRESANGSGEPASGSSLNRCVLPLLDGGSNRSADGCDPAE